LGERLANLKISTRHVDGISVVDVSGRITLGEASNMLRDQVNDLISKGDKRILLNLAEVDYCDSAGMGVLVSCLSTVRGKGGELRLVNLTKRVHDLLQITKLYNLFNVKENEVAAVAAFR
jgi:anti-sigma B factor antagonist